MNQEKIKEYQKKLEDTRAQLYTELQADESHEKFGSEGKDVINPDEESDEVEEYGNNLAVGQSHRDRINEIDNALNKIKTGEYGFCENCGREISEKVLNIIPESALCEDCKRQM